MLTHTCPLEDNQQNTETESNTHDRGDVSEGFYDNQNEQSNSDVNFNRLPDLCETRTSQELEDVFDNSELTTSSLTGGRNELNFAHNGSIIKPKPKPRMSLRKKDSVDSVLGSSDTGCLMDSGVGEGVTDCAVTDCAVTDSSMMSVDSLEERIVDVGEVQEVFLEDRSVSTTSQGSGRSLTRNFSYEAALDCDVFDAGVPKDILTKPSQEDAESEECPATKDDKAQSSDAKSQSVCSSRAGNKHDNVTGPKRKAPAPPRPAADPVGRTPPHNFVTPAPSSANRKLGEIHKQARSASPPVTAPKPAKRTIDQIRSQKTNVSRMPTSISTPSISKHLTGEDDLNASKELVHHQSSTHIQDHTPTNTGRVHQMVNALSKLAPENQEMKVSPRVKKRSSGSKFFYDLNGSEAKDKRKSSKEGVSSSGKKDKRKSGAGSVFYRDVSVSKNGTLKFQGVSDPVDNDSTTTDSESSEQTDRKCSSTDQEQMLSPKSPAESGSGESGSCESESDKEDAKSAKNTKSSGECSIKLRKQTAKGTVDDSKAVLSSDGGSSPVAPPRTKRKSRVFKPESEITASTDQADVTREEGTGVQDADNNPSQSVSCVVDSDDCDGIYVNSSVVSPERASLKERESSGQSTPNIMIHSASGSNVQKSVNEPSEEDLNSIYLPMSTSMSLLEGGHGYGKRYSDVSMASTVSDDYTQMTGENMHLLLLGLRDLQNPGARPTSWAGPNTEDGGQEPASLSALSTLKAGGGAEAILANMNDSRSTEDSSSSSSDEEEDDVDLNTVVQNLKEIKGKLEKKRKKIYCVAEEMMTSEANFVKVLRLINEDFRNYVLDAKGPLGGPVIPNKEIDQILQYLPLLQNFSEGLLKDLEARVQNWDEHPKIADVFVKKGPFLKMYTNYIRGFEGMCLLLEEARKKFPDFDKAVNEFEAGPKCSNLAIKHFMLKPIQRIPQYRMMLSEYQKNLTEVSGDLADTETALKIVSEVAEHANNSMAFGDNLKKLMEIQNSLIGPFEVIRPGRFLVKTGELLKLCRKEMQRRTFFLFSDTLLCTIPISTGFKYNSELPLSGMKVSKPGKEDFKNELSIISTTRSFTISASTPEERDQWLSVLQETVGEYNKKRHTYMLKRTSIADSPPPCTEVESGLGQQAPVWVPDARVSMCVKCHEEFTMTFRRHHCRACGKVFCGPCCDNRAPLRYQSYKTGRVCIDCFEYLKKENEQWLESLRRGGHSKDDRMIVQQLGRGFIRGTVRGQGSLWSSFGKGRRKRPTVLGEVKATEEDADMSGYMGIWESKRWKKIWFVLKAKVLYFYKASEDTAAVKSVPMIGFQVQTFTEAYQKTDPDLVFQISHRNLPPMVFKTTTKATRDMWVKNMKMATTT